MEGGVGMTLNPVVCYRSSDGGKGKKRSVDGRGGQQVDTCIYTVYP